MAPSHGGRSTRPQRHPDRREGNDNAVTSQTNAINYNGSGFGSHMADSEEDLELLVNKLDSIEQSLEDENFHDAENIGYIEQSLENLGKSYENLSNKLRADEGYNELAFDTAIDNIVSELQELEHNVGDLEMQVEEHNALKSEVAEIRNTVGSLVESQLDQKIASEFQDRKEQLTSNLIWWKAWSGISIILLLVGSSLVYLDIRGQTSADIVTLSKITLLLPLFAVVWISIDQYRQQRRLIEQYKFKISIADSLMGFREILKTDFPEGDQDQVGEFIIDSVNKMYDGPYTESANQGDEPNDESFQYNPILNRLLD